MGFDSFLNTVKKFGKIFLAGFAGGLVSYLTVGLIEGHFDQSFYSNWSFYSEGIVGGLLYLLIGIVDELLIQISFMKSLYNEMTPVYYSIVAPFLLLFFLVIAIPLINIPTVIGFIKYGKFDTLFKEIGRVLQGKLKELIVYMMIRMLFDSVAQLVQNKYLQTLNKTISYAVFVIASAASALVAQIVYELIDAELLSGSRFSFEGSAKSGLHQALVIAPFALVSLLISQEKKYIPFADVLFGITLSSPVVAKTQSLFKSFLGIFGL